MPEMNHSNIKNIKLFLSYLPCRLILMLLLISGSSTFAQRAVPQLWGHQVHDEAHVLSQQTIEQLEKQLTAYEDSTTNQIAVLVIPSLDDEVLEEYALRVAHDEWKLGQKGKDNGVLLLIAVDDHKMRIESGYGLEGVLTDAVSSRIIRNEIAPHFREQDYDAGVTAGVQAIIRAIAGEFVADDVSANSLEPPEMGWTERILIGAFVFGILGVFTFLGLFVPGCGGWFLYAFLIPFYAVFPSFVLSADGGYVTFLTYIIGFPILKASLGRTAWGKRMSSKMKSSGGSGGSGGGWSSGSGWSGGSSGGSSGGGFGGGFSGGGGGFGGGGSSGSW